MKVLTTSICNGGENETSCKENGHDSFTTDRRHATRTAAATARRHATYTKTTIPDTSKALRDVCSVGHLGFRGPGTAGRPRARQQHRSSGLGAGGLGDVKRGVCRQRGCSAPGTRRGAGVVRRGTPGRTDIGPDTCSVMYELGALGQVTARRQFLVLQKGQCHQPTWQG